MAKLTITTDGRPVLGTPGVYVPLRDDGDLNVWCDAGKHWAALTACRIDRAAGVVVCGTCAALAGAERIAEAGLKLRRPDPERDEAILADPSGAFAPPEQW